jgi:hypothetical protein
MVCLLRGAAPSTPRRVKHAANTTMQSNDESMVNWSSWLGGLSAPAALESSGTEAIPASNPIFSFANAMKRASSVPTGVESVGRGGMGAVACDAVGGAGWGWMPIIKQKVTIIASMPRIDSSAVATKYWAWRCWTRRSTEAQLLSGAQFSSSLR